MASEAIAHVVARAEAMEHLLSALAFAGLLAAQFLAVVFVAGNRKHISREGYKISESSSENRHRADYERSCGSKRT
jgi:HD-like signal output (HDOD) protein